MDAGISKKDYTNPLGNQVLSLVDLVDTQLDTCFSGGVPHPPMSIAEIFNVRKVYITRCGNSIAVAGVMAGMLSAYTGMFHCEAVEPVELARSVKLESVGSGGPDNPLVIAINAGGGAARIREILKKANEMGVFTMLLTSNRESLSVKGAKRVFLLNTPKILEDSPGFRPCFVGIVGLVVLACRMGRVRGILPPGTELEFQKVIRGCVYNYREVMEGIDEQMFELTKI